MPVYAVLSLPIDGHGLPESVLLAFVNLHSFESISQKGMNWHANTARDSEMCPCQRLWSWCLCGGNSANDGWRLYGAVIAMMGIQGC